MSALALTLCRIEKSKSARTFATQSFNETAMPVDVVALLVGIDRAELPTNRFTENQTIPSSTWTLTTLPIERKCRMVGYVAENGISVCGACHQKAGTVLADRRGGRRVFARRSLCADWFLLRDSGCCVGAIERRMINHHSTNLIVDQFIWFVTIERNSSSTHPAAYAAGSPLTLRTSLALS